MLEHLGAALAFPVVLWVLWRLQAFAVETLRRGMAQMVLEAPRFHRVISWFGTFLHETSHAVVLLITGHGIKEFHVASDQGHVLPRRRFRSMLGDAAFIAAALAPMFLVPALVLVVLVLAGPSWVQSSGGAGWDAALAVLNDGLLGGLRQTWDGLRSLDLATVAGVAVATAMLLAAPGMRPSHVKGEGWRAADEGDIAVVRSIVRRRPLLLAVAGVVLAAAYALVLVKPAWYWIPVQWVWAVGVAGILVALLGAWVWTLVALGTRTKPVVAWIPVALFVAVQILMRPDWAPAWINQVSMIAWTVSAVALRFAVPRRRRRF